MKSLSLFLLFSLGIFSLVQAQNFKFGKVSKEELQQKEHPVDPSANAAVLYRETKSEFQYTASSGWYLVTDYFERVKIYNKEGFDWANITVDLYKSGYEEDKLQGLRGYTYYLDENGKMEKVKLRNDGIFEQETTKYLSQTKIAMPDVREGCVVEYKYTINSPFIFNIDAFRLQEKIPVDKATVMFKTPEYFHYKTHQRGWIPIDMKTEDHERSMTFSYTHRDNARLTEMRSQTELVQVKFTETTYNIDVEKVPSLKEEAFAGNINNYTGAMQFEMSFTEFPGSSIKTYATTWADVSRSIYKTDLFGGELDKRNFFEKDVDRLLEGVTKPEEKLVRIFFFVMNKMTWNGYTGYFTNEGVKNAYKKEVGNVADINLMLISMLRYANLQASPVLVSTKSHGFPLFPTRTGFNYVIAAVELPSGSILLDATNKNANIGVLRSEVINGEGRILVAEDYSDWISLRSRIPAIKSSMVSATINEDMSLSGKVQNRFSGNYAHQYRSQFRGLESDAQRKTIEKSVSGTDISNVDFENINAIYEPLAMAYDFEAAGAVEEVGGKLFFSPLSFLAKKENPLKAETREYPVDFEFPIKDRYIVTIDLPEGYKVESMPEGVVYNLEGNLGSYRYAINEMGQKLQLSVEWAINESFIAAHEYANLKKFFELCVSKEKEKVVLIKT